MHANRVIPIGAESEMCDLYRGGKTLQAIGDVFGISRERVRQIVSSLGLKRSDGGQTIGANENRAKKKADRERKFKARAKHLGMSVTELKEHLAKYGAGSKSPLLKYRSHRQAAKKRGIGWEFNFGTWWRLWQESGKWELRGRGKYVMARHGDDGPYSKGNVYICTGSQNSKDAIANKPWHTRVIKKRKISTEDAEAIKKMTGTNKEISKLYGVDPSTISLVRRGITKAGRKN